MFNGIPSKFLLHSPHIEKVTLKFLWKHKRLWRAKAILSKKDQHWRYHNIWIQTILQSYSNKNSMALGQRQTWRPIEQNRRPRYESTQLHPSEFWQRCPKHMMEKRQTLQQMLLGKLQICMQKTETDPCLSPCSSINSKWVKDLNI
jgi:hypothetical protein